MPAKSIYEYECPRCGDTVRTPINLSAQPTCNNFKGHGSKNLYWMIPTDKSATPKHSVSTNTRGTRA